MHRFADVERLDVEPAVEPVGEVVQLRASRSCAHGARYVPAFVQERLRHRELRPREAATSRSVGAFAFDTVDCMVSAFAGFRHAATIGAHYDRRQTHQIQLIVASHAMSNRTEAYPVAMEDIDLNLVTALDVLLSEGSVTGAARRQPEHVRDEPHAHAAANVHRRSVARARRAQARADAARRRVARPRASIASDARAVLRPATADVDMATHTSTFTLRAAASFMEMLSGPVVAALGEIAPQVRIRFVPKPDRDPQALRDGTVDLEIGKRGDDAPSCTPALFHDWHVAVARAGHPLFASGRITPARYAACRHVIASQLGDFGGPADDSTDKAGPSHAVQVVVPGYPDAMRVAASTDLIALVPRSSLGNAFSPPRRPSGCAASRSRCACPRYSCPRCGIRACTAIPCTVACAMRSSPSASARIQTAARRARRHVAPAHARQAEARLRPAARRRRCAGSRHS